MESHYLNMSQESATDRFPQWSINETREFLAIRAELDQTFMETKRNKLLWNVISSKMKEKGYNRSSEQCKCKWKNLVTRYKGSETMEMTENMRQFPFHEELRTIFAARMQRMLWLEAGGGASGSGKKKGIQSSSEEDDSDGVSQGDKEGGKKKRKGKVSDKGKGSSSSKSGNMQEVLEEFMRQQMEMDVQRQKVAEAREEERKMKEIEWRQTMEALERERMMMDRRWREREEQRRIREDARAEKRDALITTLLNKLMHDNV